LQETAKTKVHGNSAMGLRIQKRRWESILGGGERNPVGNGSKGNGRREMWGERRR